jgi:hypothetical protein
VHYTGRFSGVANWPVLGVARGNQHLAADAIRMLDWGDKPQRYMLPGGDSATITMPIVRQALADADSEDQVILYVRECFDWLLYYLDRVGQYVHNGLILLEDVRPVLGPYAALIKASELQCSELAVQRGYQFLEDVLGELAAKQAEQGSQIKGEVPFLEPIRSA